MWSSQLIIFLLWNFYAVDPISRERSKLPFPFRLPGLGKELCKRWRKICYKECEKEKEGLYGTPAGDAYYHLNDYKNFNSEITNYGMYLLRLHSSGSVSWSQVLPPCELPEHQHPAGRETCMPCTHPALLPRSGEVLACGMIFTGYLLCSTTCNPYTTPSEYLLICSQILKKRLCTEKCPKPFLMT